MRIIAGKYRGRPLSVPRGRAIRPTSDMARQALFNIIGPRIAGAEFLDLFAGSGAVGLEALSRGAAGVTALETHTETAVKNVEKLGLDGVEPYRLIRGDVFAQLARLARDGTQFGFIFADPPWDAGLEQRIAATAAPLLADGGWLILELNRKTPPPDGAAHGLEALESRRYGEAVFWIYTRN